jgi:hypothetical protein
MREIRAADVRPRKKKPAGREQADSSHCRMNPDLGPQACRLPQPAHGLQEPTLALSEIDTDGDVAAH